jgi:Na+-transporting NADH:ubiquinone oxidoreductase subunit C
MSKLNTNTNGYTILFLVIMVIIVGGALATVSSLAKPIIDKNIELDTKTKILKSVQYSGTDVLADYNSKIEAIAIDSAGNIIEGVDGYDLVVKKEYKKPVSERSYPLFIYSDGGKKNYIVPLIGLGLWDEVNGFAAFNDDLKTLKGAAFDHVAETPGLGAEITKAPFRDQFNDIIVYNKKGEYVLNIWKQGKSPGGDSDVDGLAGATLTTDGMQDMMKKCIPNYQYYFKSLKKK